MKILMVTDVLFFPPCTGNRRRIYNECEMLKKMNWNIDLFFFGGCSPDELSVARSFLSPGVIYTISGNGYDVKKKSRMKIREKFDSIITPIRYSEDELYNHHIEERLLYTINENEYDAVWLQYFFMSKIIGKSKNSITYIIDTHDRYAMRDMMYRRIHEKVDGIYTSYLLERKLLGRADLVLAIQDKENKYFKRLLFGKKAKIFTLGDIIKKNDCSIGIAKTYGMIGNSYSANAIALKWFINYVLPIIKKCEPDSNFVIAGKMCDSISNSEDYEKMGMISNLSDFYNRVRFVIAPLRNGTGLKIKCIEALSYGKPIVTTSFGAEGLKDASDAIIIADEPSKFAKAVISILQNEEREEHMRTNAYAFVNNYSVQNEKVLSIIEDNIKLKKKNYGL